MPFFFFYLPALCNERCSKIYNGEVSVKHFTLDADEYGRDLNILSAYKRDAVKYLQVRTGKSTEECLAYVERTTGPGGKHEVTDPEVFCLSKNKYGDREELVIPFSKYLEDVVARRAIISPTMAVYLNPNEKRSILSKYISKNIKRRGEVKREAHAAEMAGRTAESIEKNILQTTFKLKNNALSGAHSSPYTTVYLKSAHSTLTSTCRSATGYGNANNEKFLYGNRHYWSPDVVKSNIISIVNNTDYDKLSAVMVKYDIKEPTPEETLACITYSTDLYWRNKKQVEDIKMLVSGLTGLERAAFVYTGDLYHLRILNDRLVRDFIDKLSTKATVPVEDPDYYIKAMDADLYAFVSLLCADELGGSSLSAIKESNPHGYSIVGATAKWVVSVLDEYRDMIQALWVTPNVPSSVAALPSSIRRGAITSDTDSTIFTVQDWTRWFVGKVDFSEKSLAVAHTTVYLASQTIIHVLANMTSNMGVVPEQLHQLAMKNEYSFPVFGLTSRSKHYFAYVSAKEGNVLPKMGVDVKGVALKSSNCPPHVMAQVKKLITDTMDMVMEGNGISIIEIMNRVATIELDIIKSINEGGYEYLTTKQLRSHESYKAGMNSAQHQSYLMWNEVFGEAYGTTPPPPYFGVQVSIDADSPTKLRAWLARMPNQDVAAKMAKWLESKGRKGVTTMMLPESVCAMRGVPPEVICGLNTRKLIYATMEAFYMILESLGFYMVNGNHTRLVSDYWVEGLGVVLDDGSAENLTSKVV